MVIAIGLYTFFVPLAIVEPPVMNRTDWSALNIALNVCWRKLPVPGGRFDEGLIEIALIYLLMPFALVALYLPGPPTALKVVSGIGSILGSLAKFWKFAFVQTFFGFFGHTVNWHVRFGPASWALPWVMPLLFAICIAGRLDA